jgi:hypothetical protein
VDECPPTIGRLKVLVQFEAGNGGRLAAASPILISPVEPQLLQILTIQFEQIKRPQRRRLAVFAGMQALKIADAELV